MWGEKAITEPRSEDAGLLRDSAAAKRYSEPVDVAQILGRFQIHRYKVQMSSESCQMETSLRGCDRAGLVNKGRLGGKIVQIQHNYAVCR